MLGIFPVLGVDVFDKPAPSDTSERRYFLDERNGKGVERSDGFHCPTRRDAFPGRERSALAKPITLSTSFEIVTPVPYT